MGEFYDQDQHVDIGADATSEDGWTQDPADTQSFGKPETFSRRDFLYRTARTGFGALVIAQLGLGAEVAARHFVRHEIASEGRDKARHLFEAGISRDWHKFSIFSGLLQIDPAVRVSNSPFKNPGAKAAWPMEKFSLAIRPISVRATLLRNIADYDQDTQNSVDRILHTIPPRLVAFWQPEATKLSYCDIDENRGLILPFEKYRSVNGQHIPMTDVNIGGREVREDQVFPYIRSLDVKWQPPDFVQAELDKLRDAAGTNPDAYYKAQEKSRQDISNYKPVETQRLIGQCVTADTADELNGLISNFYDGGEPLALTDYPAQS